MVVVWIEEAGFISLLEESSTASQVRLKTISHYQAHAWLRIIPSPRLDLNLKSPEMQVQFLSFGWAYLCAPYTPMPFLFICPCCSWPSFTNLHARWVCHLWDCFADFCQLASLAPEVEKGCNFAVQPGLHAPCWRHCALISPCSLWS